MPELSIEIKALKQIAEIHPAVGDLKAINIATEALKALGLEYIIEETEESRRIDAELFKEEQQRGAGKLKLALQTSIEDLQLSGRSYNCLKSAKINSIAELVQYTPDDLMKYRNFGNKSIYEVENVLHEIGLRFGMNKSEVDKIISPEQLQLNEARNDALLLTETL